MCFSNTIQPMTRCSVAKQITTNPFSAIELRCSCFCWLDETLERSASNRRRATHTRVGLETPHVDTAQDRRSMRRYGLLLAAFLTVCSAGKPAPLLSQVEPHLHLSMAAFHHGDLGVALAAAKAAVRMAPLDAMVHSALGDILTQHGIQAHNKSNHQAASRFFRAAVTHHLRSASLGAPSFASALADTRTLLDKMITHTPYAVGGALSILTGPWVQAVLGKGSLVEALQEHAIEQQMLSEGALQELQDYRDYKQRQAEANGFNSSQLLVGIEASGPNAWLPNVPESAFKEWAAAEEVPLGPQAALAAALFDNGYMRKAVQMLCKPDLLTVNVTAASGLSLGIASMPPAQVLQATTALRVCGVVHLTGAVPPTFTAAVRKAVREGEGGVSPEQLLQLLQADAAIANPLVHPVLHRAMQTDFSTVSQAYIEGADDPQYEEELRVVQRLSADSGSLFSLEDLQAPASGALTAQRLMSVFGPPHGDTLHREKVRFVKAGQSSGRLDAVGASVTARGAAQDTRGPNLSVDFVPVNGMVPWPRSRKTNATALGRQQAGLASGAWALSVAQYAAAMSHTQHGYLSTSSQLPAFMVHAVFPLGADTATDKRLDAAAATSHAEVPKAAEGRDPPTADGSDARAVPEAWQVGNPSPGKAPIAVAVVPGSHIVCMPDVRAAATATSKHVKPMHPTKQVPTAELASLCPEALPKLVTLHVKRGDVLLMDSRLDREIRRGPGATKLAHSQALHVLHTQPWPAAQPGHLPAVLQSGSAHARHTLSPLAANTTYHATTANATAAERIDPDSPLAPQAAHLDDLNALEYGSTLHVGMLPPDAYWKAARAADNRLRRAEQNATTLHPGARSAVLPLHLPLHRWYMSSGTGPGDEGCSAEDRRAGTCAWSQHASGK